MGEIESGQDQVDLRTGELLRFSKIFVAIMVLLGIFAPVLMTSFGYIGDYDFTIQSLFWYFHIGTFGSDWWFFPIYASFSLLPYVALRMVPAYMIYIYYQKRTTKKRAALGVIVGDLLFILGSIPSFFTFFLFPFPYLIIPSPFQMLIGFLILWRFPIPEPTKPWESSEGTRPWWEKDTIDESKSPDVDNAEDWLD